MLEHSFGDYDILSLLCECKMHELRNFKFQKIWGQIASYQPWPFNIGIKHGFPCINICQVPREVLKNEVEDRGF